MGGADGTVVLSCFGEGVESEDGNLDNDLPHELTGLKGVEIWLMKCEGPVEGWELMEKWCLVE